MCVCVGVCVCVCECMFVNKQLLIRLTLRCVYVFILALRDGRILHEVAAGKRKLDITELRGVFDVNCRDDYGATPILTAIRNENVGFVAILLANGADINMKDKRDWNAKQLANFYGKNIKKLIDNYDRNANSASENQ